MSNNNRDFISSIFLSLTGKKLEKRQERILKKCFEEFWQFKDDPIEPPSSAIALLMASCNQKLPQVLASTINSFGVSHFCFSDVYLFLKEKKHFNKPFPGFGHPKYKHSDPRVSLLLKEFSKNHYKNKWLNKLIEAGDRNGLKINIAGLFACVLIDCGCDEYNIDYFPIMCRSLGLTQIYQDACLKKIKFDSAQNVIKQFNCADRQINKILTL